MESVRLDDPRTLPDRLIKRLAPYAPLIRRSGFIEQLFEDRGFKSVAAEVDEFITGGTIRAYHCTKELKPGTFAREGLRLLDSKRHIAEFMGFIAGSQCPFKLQEDFRAAYDDWLRSDQIRCRDGMIWFCLSPFLVFNDGTGMFFKYFGGETLYWPFAEGSPARDFLAALGRPVVVEVAIPACELTTYQALPFARDILSHYARRLNPIFHVNSLEGNLRRPVAPREITAVHERADFLQTYGSTDS